MNFWTWAQLRSKVERDLSLEDEIFVDATEMLGYANEAILEAEVAIHTLYEDYFLSRTNLVFAAGVETYSLPTDIYGHKIRTIRYNNGSRLYEITRIKDWHKFADYDFDNYNPSAQDRYEYLLLNAVAGQPALIVISPLPQETGTVGRIWYLRHANRLVLDTDVLDIPEATNFILQYIKMRCYEAEGHFNLQKSVADTMAAKEQFEAVMSTMVPDTHNEIEQDQSIYETMS